MTRKLETSESEGVPARINWRATPTFQTSPILSAALDAFSEKGYEATSVRDIARRVGVTVPALYYHHENKEHILISLLMESIQRVITSGEAALEDAGSDQGRRLLYLLESIIRYMTGSFRMARLDPESRSLSPESLEAYHQQRRRVERMVLEEIEAARALGLIAARWPNEAARALLGMFQAIPIWYDPRGKSTPDQIAERYLEIAAHALDSSPALLSTLHQNHACAVARDT